MDHTIQIIEEEYIQIDIYDTTNVIKFFILFLNYYSVSVKIQVLANIFFISTFLVKIKLPKLFY